MTEVKQIKVPTMEPGHYVISLLLIDDDDDIIFGPLGYTKHYTGYQRPIHLKTTSESSECLDDYLMHMPLDY